MSTASAFGGRVAAAPAAVPATAAGALAAATSPFYRARRGTGRTSAGSVAHVGPPSLRTLALGWSPDPAAVVLVGLAGALYAAGARRLAARGRPWPTGRAVAYFCGLATVLVATSSGLARYDVVLFSAHGAQHVLLGMVAPVLLALGAPVTLALQASSRPTQTALLRLVRSGPLALLTSPVVAWVLFGATLFGLYFTPLFELSLRNGLVHAAVHAHFLVAGCLFCWAAVGVDPVAHRLPHGARLLFVLVAVPFHAVLGLALTSSADLLAGGFYADVGRTWGASALADQRTGAGVLWGAGELFGLVLAGVVLAQWARHDEREAARHDRRDAAARRRSAGLTGP